MSGFRSVGEEPIWAGQVISVARGHFVAPDGTRFDRDVVHHPGAVSVVPVQDRHALLVRQYRAAIGTDLLEIPAGKRDVADEPPEETARRELAEEAGMSAGRLRLLARFYNSPGFCDELSFVFLAEDLTEVQSDLQGPEEQHLVRQAVDLDAVPSLIASGELQDAKTIIGLLLARTALA